MDIVVFVVVAICPFAVAGDRPAVDYRLSFGDRLSRIRSVIAAFRQETVYTPAPEREGSHLPLSHVYKGLYVEQGQFSFLDGRALYEVEYAPETVQRLEAEKVVFVRKTVKAYALDRADSLWIHSKRGNAAGRVSDSEKLPHSYPIDVALGLRCHLEQAWLDRSRLEDAVCTAANGGRVLIRMTDRFLPDVTHQWEVDPTAHFAIVRYQCIEPKGFTSCDIKCSDFVIYGELALPRVIEGRYMAPGDAGLDVTRTVRVTVTECTLNSAENTAERYYISFPSKSLIRDKRIDVPFQAATTRPFADREIFELAKAMDAKSEPRPDPSNAVSRLVWIVASAALIVLLLLYAHLYRRSNSRTAGK